MIQPLDQMRRATLGAALSAPSIRFFIVDKDRRIAAHALLCVVVAALVAMIAPWLSLVVGPLLLGVPHLASEARWLVVRQRPTTSFIRTSSVLAIALAGVATWSWLGGPRALLDRAEIVLAGTWMIVAIGTYCPPKRPAVIALAIMIAAITSLAALFAANEVREIVVGLHGFVTLAIWAFAFRKKKLFVLPAVVATLVGIAYVASLRGPIVAQAFLQSVHYAVWITLVPQDGARGAGTPTFAMSVRGWKKDLGRRGIALVAIASATVIALALAVGPGNTRDGYLVVARFHVWLELAMAAALGSVALRSLERSAKA